MLLVGASPIFVVTMQSSRSALVALGSSKKIFGRLVSTATASDQENALPLKTFKDIPGPSSFPIIGPMLNFIPGLGAFANKLGYELSDELYKQYGPISKLDGLFGRPPFVFLFDAEAAAYVLRNENTLPIRPGFQSIEYFRKEYDKDRKSSYTGLITDHGESWKTLRSIVNPVLLQPKTMKLYQTVLDEVASDMIARMKTLRDKDGMIKDDFEIEMNKWSLESIGVVALGGRIGCLDPDLPVDSPARQLIQCVNDIFHYANELDFKPSLWRYLPTKTYKKAMEAYGLQKKLSIHFIRRAVEEMKTKGVTALQDEKSVLQKLLEIDEEIAVIMASDMLFAGVDTAANSIIGALSLLASNPDKQDKLREEIQSKSERKPYLRACIKETMRLLPIVSGNLRKTTKEYNILGYVIPKDTNLILGHEYLSKMESEFPQASQFLPERWVVEKSSPLHHGRAHPFAMSPFGFGVRQCVGRRIADLELETFLQRLMRSFRVTLRGPPPRVQPTSLNYMAGPYNFVFNDV